MWFGTGDGLNRYDGNSFVLYKNIPNDPGSLSANFIRDLVEDNHGALWLAVYPGVNKFDPTTERTTRYLHDPEDPNSLSGDSVGASPATVAAIFGSQPQIADWTGLTRRPRPSLITAPTAMASLLDGSPVSSRIAVGTSGLLASAACFI